MKNKVNTGQAINSKANENKRKKTTNSYIIIIPTKNQVLDF